MVKKLIFGPLLVALLVVFAISSSPALAWTHELNNWDSNPSQPACGGSSTLPCLYWAQPNNLSIKLYADLTSSLNLGYYNFSSSLQGAFNDYNAVSAYNPYIATCTSNPCGPIIYFMADLGYGIYGVTYVGNHSSASYGNGQYYATINTAPDSVTVQFNTEITWNNSLQFSDTTADGRKVAAHETGHAMGLGHTARAAIMHQGAVSFYTLQSDDIAGLQAIYPGYYPA